MLMSRGKISSEINAVCESLASEMGISITQKGLAILSNVPLDRGNSIGVDPGRLRETLRDFLTLAQQIGVQQIDEKTLTRLGGALSAIICGSADDRPREGRPPGSYRLHQVPADPCRRSNRLRHSTYILRWELPGQALVNDCVSVTYHQRD